MLPKAINSFIKSQMDFIKSKRIFKYLPIFVVLLVFISCDAMAKEPLGFREFHLGMKKDEALKKLPHCEDFEKYIDTMIGKVLSGDKDYSAGCFYKDEFIYTFFDIKEIRISVNFQFKNEKLVMIAFNFKPKEYDVLKEALIQKFGKPTKKEHEILQNAMGASFHNEALTWFFPNGTVAIGKYTDDIEHGLALISPVTNKELNQIKKKKQAAPGF